ncbi:MAG: efflux RND transporter periplasmic adaptor subunit [Verrucomicrobia bacterium]|jgi:RND family efflux transporter MFP subunit|nr:efflux RND transporter periplasmic adaptor subunit [Verrucomicrobiota bacterium]
MNADKLKSLSIERSQKSRPTGMLWTIFIVVIVATLAAIFFAWPKAGDKVRVLKNSMKPPSSAATSAGGTTASAATASATNSAPAQTPGADVVLTVSGYIINRERIEISPRFMGVVKWIGVKKGDAVTNGQVVVLLDDTEFKARLAQADGAVATAKASVAKAQVLFDRVKQLAATEIESKQAQDDARLMLEGAAATLRESEGARQVAQTYVDWCTIRSPINGVVLEKLVDPNELVTPQSFGGTRGPSTALIAVADPKDLQVEIDLNEADLSKISLKQKCRVSPEAYLDKTYEGYVAEIAPEANRSKGTLQIKVQIANPDKFLTPELSAKVEFLKK